MKLKTNEILLKLIGWFLIVTNGLAIVAILTIVNTTIWGLLYFSLLFLFGVIIIEYISQVNKKITPTEKD